jgi:hypothetical protein
MNERESLGGINDPGREPAAAVLSLHTEIRRWL